MTSKRELVLRAIRGEEVERVPVGFWFHFVTLEEKGQGLNNPRIFQKSVEGHRQYVERIHPDFVKIMSDGFFFIQVMSIVLLLQVFRSWLLLSRLVKTILGFSNK